MPRLISGRVAWRACVALIAAGSAVSSAYADIIVTEGVQPWHLCATCHSLDGISAMARFPKLAGQRAAYIVKQVRDFRDGRRSNDGGQMQASASDIVDACVAGGAISAASGKSILAEIEHTQTRDMITTDPDLLRDRSLSWTFQPMEGGG